ncbi:HTTM domain-containing protein [Aquimarina longa]|uniref:HTTM domain-containing protein n=1 Tax=Aquimarina longa TaxID=1080221 RepID=UPI000AA224E5|nr:HTTM domain-containing protein [Aquimarina longa]
MTAINKVYARFTKQTSILPLVVFRIAFGILMCFSQLRFMYKGWIEACYTTPKFHFTYHYFHWVVPFDPPMMYIIVGGSALCAFLIAIGMFYRVAIFLFFITFTYLELVEKAWYLNHYYFVSLVAFLLLWIPAHRNYSIDALIYKKIRLHQVPLWTIKILQLQIAIVYIFGGIAKLKSDWLLAAQPLKIWLLARTDIPILGVLFHYSGTAYVFSWLAMLYDLSIPFLLWNKRYRLWAYSAVIVFHVLTYLLFNIGMFPWLMIASSLIFITPEEWKTIGEKLSISIKKIPVSTTTARYITHRSTLPIIAIYILFQITFPLRHMALTDTVLWTENGLRFSWHVMIREKNGVVAFRIVDHDTQKKFTVYPSQYLSIIQEKQMSFQPDMIWQFAHFLKEEYQEQGATNLSIYVDTKVALNGRASQTFLDPNIDILRITTIDEVYNHVLPMTDF